MSWGEFLFECLGDLGAFFREKSPKTGPEFTPRARQVFALARSEATRRRHRSIEVTHFLLALVHFGKNAGRDALHRLGVDPAILAHELESTCPAGRFQSKEESLPYSNNLKKCLAFAVREGNSMNHRYIGTDHLLLGLMRVGEKPIVAFFDRHGLTVGRLREDIRNHGNRAVSENE